MTIEQMYKSRCEQKSDINEHLPTLYRYAEDRDHITEFGTRFGVSIWAFLKAGPEKCHTYDIVREKSVDEIERICKEEKQHFEFHLKSSLETEIETTELLFIDTRHTEKQVFQELTLHERSVAEYIIMHDVVSFGETGEEGERGLNYGIREFLSINSDWRINDYYTNNNGLLVLRRR